MNLSYQQITKLSKSLFHLYSSAQVEEIPGAFMLAVRQILDCEHLSYNEFGQNHFRGIVEPLIETELNQVFQALAAQHPSIRHIEETGCTEAVKISDFVTQEAWEKTTLYNEFFRPLGVRYQLALMFPVGNIHIGFAANRGRRDFSEDERFLMSLLQPHFLQAYLNAKALDRAARAGDSHGGGTVVLSSEGAVLFCSPKARKSIQRFFGPSRGRRLPDELRRWVMRGLEKTPFGGPAPQPQLPLTRQGEHSILTIRLIPNHSLGEHVIIVDEQPVEIPYHVFEQFGHSRREAEVLSWIAQGKTNPEIAIILDISVRTVAHHVERILARIGVEGRGSASAWAQETIRVHRLSWDADEGPRVVNGGH